MEISRDRNYSVGSVGSAFELYTGTKPTASFGTYGFLPIKADSQVPQKDDSVDYYEECCRLYMQTLALCSKANELAEENTQIRARIEMLQNSVSRASSKPNENSRRRRLANEIERHFICVVCNKSYGAEGSLNQHIRLKHAD